MIGGGGGANTDRVVKGHCEGEGAGGGREAETTSILQSEWEAIKRSIVAAVKHISMEKKISSSGQGGGGGGGGRLQRTGVVRQRCSRRGNKGLG